MSRLMAPGQQNEYQVVQQDSEVLAEKRAWEERRQEAAARAAAQMKPLPTHRRPKGFLCGGSGNGSGWGGGNYR